jgi:hypothetical protein
MNESSWADCQNPEQMLESLRRDLRLHRAARGKRKLRLFACGCLTRLGDVLTDPRCRTVLDTAERVAEGTAGADEVLAGQELAHDILTSIQKTYVSAHANHLTGPHHDIPFPDTLECRRHLASWYAAEALLECLAPQVWQAAQRVSACLARAVTCTHELSGVAGPEARADLLREVFGNPFRFVCPDTDWLEWNDGLVWKMARAIHDGRQFEDLPFLADALEDAGCTDAEILGHCRGPGPHVRGCWLLDLLVGKG